jgi:hypothetical protein
VHVCGYFEKRRLTWREEGWDSDEGDGKEDEVYLYGSKKRDAECEKTVGDDTFRPLGRRGVGGAARVYIWAHKVVQQTRHFAQINSMEICPSWSSLLLFINLHSARNHLQNVARLLFQIDSDERIEQFDKLCLILLD